MAELTDEQIKAVAQRDECLRPAQGDGYELDEVAFARAILALSATGTEDAERWQTFVMHMGTRFPGPAYGHRLKLVEICPMYGEEKDIGMRELIAMVDAARTQSNGAAGGGEVSHGE